MDNKLRHCIVKIAKGSGVVIKGKSGVPFILTCTHVLKENLKDINVAFCNINGEFPLPDENNDLINVTVLKYLPTDDKDIAILACPKLPEHYYSVQLLESKYGRHAPLHTFGFPKKLSVNGRSNRCLIDDTEDGFIINKSGEKLLKLVDQEKIEPGFSGGPLLESGFQYCVGLIGYLEPPTDFNSATLLYAIPAETIAESFQDMLDVQRFSAYHAELRAMYQALVLGDNKNMRLSDIYVEPYFAIHRDCFNEKDERVRPTNDTFIKIEKSLNQELIEIFNNADHLDLKIKKPGLILLLGSPGQGKTSFCKRLIYDLIGGGKFKNIYFVKLNGVPDPKNLVTNALKTIQTEIEGERELEFGKISWKNTLLVLDGLDELNIRTAFQRGDIEAICKNLEKATEKFEGLRVLLNSRSGYIDLEGLKEKNILIIRLENLSKVQQLFWLEKYKAKQFHPESPLTPEKLEALHHHRSFQELLGQPILLHMIANIGKKVSDSFNRAAIYDLLFKELTNRSWVESGQIDFLSENGIDSKTLRYALQDIAHAIFMSGKGYLNREDLEKLKNVEVINKMLQESNRGIELWRTIMIASYLGERKKISTGQIENGQTAYGIEFLHNSLYEYLCAEMIWREVSNCLNDLSCDERKVLALVHNVFSERALTPEVNEYLIEIIDNQNNKNKRKKLATRMAKYLPFCLENHFLNYFDSKREKMPFGKAVANFKGFWLILSNLDKEKNFLLTRKSANFLVELCCNQTFESSFFSGFRLNFQDLEGANFKGANLSGVDLSEANLEKAILINSDLSDATLNLTKFNKAKLQGATLKNAKMSKAKLFDADLSEANLSEAILDNAGLRGAILKESKLTLAFLLGADLRWADLRWADLSWATLNEAILADTDLRGAKLVGSTFGKADLNDADLAGADLSETDVNFDQLLSCKSLFETIGIKPDIIDKLMIEKSSLFEKPQSVSVELNQ